MESYELAKLCAKALSEKKAQDIVILSVAEQTVVCSYFVIASGRSTTQVKALGDAVEEKLKKELELSPVRTEGFREGRWGVLDYGDVVVHVFHEESRLFYYLERLWDSGKNVERYED
ncbi:MAG: ribosome silencing factor [Clostridia bacterium]|nr:ribosome silencing factor [Clostridia bacterium]